MDMLSSQRAIPNTARSFTGTYDEANELTAANNQTLS